MLTPVLKYYFSISDKNFKSLHPSDINGCSDFNSFFIATKNHSKVLILSVHNRYTPVNSTLTAIAKNKNLCFMSTANRYTPVIARATAITKTKIFKYIILSNRYTPVFARLSAFVFFAVDIVFSSTFLHKKNALLTKKRYCYRYCVTILRYCYCRNVTVTPVMLLCYRYSVSFCVTVTYLLLVYKFLQDRICDRSRHILSTTCVLHRYHKGIRMVGIS